MPYPVSRAILLFTPVGSVDIIECTRVHGKLVDTKETESKMLRAINGVTGSWPENNWESNIVLTMLWGHYCIPAALNIGLQ